MIKLLMSEMGRFLLVSKVIKDVDPSTIEDLGKKTFSIWTIIQKFNYMSIYQWLVDNAWITVAGYKVPLFVLIIIGFMLVAYIARKIRSITMILLIMALIAFANTFIQFTVGA